MGYGSDPVGYVIDKYDWSFEGDIAKDPSWLIDTKDSIKAFLSEPSTAAGERVLAVGARSAGGSPSGFWNHGVIPLTKSRCESSLVSGGRPLRQRPAM